MVDGWVERLIGIIFYFVEIIIFKVIPVAFVFLLTLGVFVFLFGIDLWLVQTFRSLYFSGGWSLSLDQFLTYLKGFAAGTILVSGYVYILLDKTENKTDASYWGTIFGVAAVAIAGLKIVPASLMAVMNWMDGHFLFSEYGLFIFSNTATYGDLLTTLSQGFFSSFYLLPIIFFVLVVRVVNQPTLPRIAKSFLKNFYEVVLENIYESIYALLRAGVPIVLFAASMTYLVEVLIVG